MSLTNVAASLSEAAKSGQAVFVHFEPDVLDFTIKEARADMLICYQGGGEVRLTLDRENLPVLLSLLQFSIFEKGRKVICWDLKQFFSFARYCSGKDFKTEAAIIDLKLLESYISIDQPKPKSLAEALLRLKALFGTGLWDVIQPIYKRIHLPLMTQVIPAIEARGLLHVGREAAVYPYYDIDGQNNGRLRCFPAFTFSYNPHSLGPEDRQNLKPRDQDDFFMYFDYQQCEVAVLHWLSQDEALGEMMSSGQDFYAVVWEKVTGQKPDEKSRDKTKKFFLPVIYGQSPQALSERIGVSLTTAESIVQRISRLFSKAWKWVEQYHLEAVANHVVHDHYGRRRRFEEKEYKARNFSVQAPAAVICLDRLICLHRQLSGIAPIAYHVHDGFVVLANKKNYKQVYIQVRTVLEAESDLAVGLRLRVNCKAGRSLDSLKPIVKKGEQEGGP